MKKLAAILPILVLFMAAQASAHVSVKPSQAGVGSFQTFTVSVPNEKDIPTTGVRLVIPEGLEHVSPTVKPGWNVQIKSEGQDGDGDHEEGVVSELVWTGGSIPAHFRDDFTFSARVPGAETSILWKAYQTYRDGTVVAWELGPDQEQPKKADGTSDFSQVGPASSTKVVDDLKAQTQASEEAKMQQAKINNAADSATIIGLLAVLISGFALYFARRRTM